MTRITYFPEIECEATPSSLHETEVVTVQDATENPQSLRVAKGFLTKDGGKKYLPVRVIDFSQDDGRVLVQLPYEADSGVNRIWVLLKQFRKLEAEPNRKAGNVA